MMTESLVSILEHKDRKIWSVSSDTSVYDAIATMAAKSIGALLVVDREELVGIVSERDYARKVMLKGKSSKETTVGEIMTSPVITVTPDRSIEDCMQIMTAQHIRHVPVMDGGRIVGLVSIGDLVKAVISTQAHTIDQLNQYISGRYPA